MVHSTKTGRKLIARVYAEHANDMEMLVSASLTSEEREGANPPVEEDRL